MFDSTIHLGDIILFVVGAILLPVIKNIYTASMTLNSTVVELTYEMRGMNRRVDKLEELTDEHRVWLISLKDRRIGDK